MHSFGVIAGLVLVCILIQDGAAQRRHRQRYRADELSRASSSFGFRLYRNLASSRNEDNIIVSPFSVFAALSMMLLGTDGTTKQELRTVLAQRPRQGIHQALDSYLDSIPSNPNANVTLRIANALYYDRRINLLNVFSDNIDRLYGASPEAFRRPSPEEPINRWVEKSTGGKIRNFFSPGEISADVVILLLNAVFFQGTWREIFDERMTSRQNFVTASGRVVRVPMMTRDGAYSVKILQDLRASVLELPFGTDNRFSLFIVLPDQQNGLPQLEADLTSEVLEEALGNMPQAHRYMISVPKFTLRMKTSMKETLKSMGLDSIFTPKGDLSRMVTGLNLTVSDVKHEAVIEVDEKGATAAAVTAIGVVAISLPPSFRADHPFLLVLRDNSARLNLFMGRLNNPSQP